MRLASLLVVAFALGAPATAQEAIIGSGVFGGAASGYTGPGDVVSGATAWYGLRAYKASYTGGKAVNLVRASDSTACDFDIASTGGLGLSDSGCSLGGGLTLSAFATTDATASCSLSIYTLTCSGASSTPHVGSQVTGAGLRQPCYVTAVGTFTGGAGTVTTGNSFFACSPTSISAESMTFTYALRVAELYDQTGNGHNATQTTNASRPYLIQNCIGSLPCIFVNAYVPTYMTGTISSTSDPVTVSSVMMRPENIGSDQTVFSVGAGSTKSLFGFGNGSNIALLWESSNFTVTANDDVAHALQFVADGASSSINVDGSITTGSSGSVQSGSTAISIGTFLDGSSFAGYAVFSEFGLYASGLSSGNQNSLCHNQNLYSVLGLSC